MFFDKIYRRQRYDCIVDEMNNYSNINEFRTLVVQKHYRFPLTSIRNISFLKLKAPEDDLLTTNAEASDERSENILLERTYMKLFWKVFQF